MDIQINMTDKMQETNTFTMTKPVGIGARLKAAREAMNLSERDAAARLHLSVRFIDIMENEDFENGPPAIFLRGYLRSYAHLVNLPKKDINDAIERLDMNTPKAATFSSPKLNTSPLVDLDPYVRWITYVIIFVLITLVAIWWSSRSNETDTLDKTISPSPTASSTTGNPIPSNTNPVQTQPINNNAGPNATPQPGPAMFLPNNAQQAGQTVPLNNTQQPGQNNFPGNNSVQQSGQVPVNNVQQPGQAQINNTQQPGQVQTNYNQQPGQVPMNNAQQSGQIPINNAQQQPGQNVAPINPDQQSGQNMIPAQQPGQEQMNNVQQNASQPGQPNMPGNPVQQQVPGSFPPNAQQVGIQGNAPLAGQVNSALPQQPINPSGDQNSSKHRRHQVHMEMAVPEPGLF